jgi:RNA polymerase sigma factor (sigma-70 family)
MGMPTTTTAHPTRPTRAEIEPAALDLVRRRGAEILATARRYAATPEDAEDAYQRGLEILLTKAPSTDEDDLVPWLKTVVKHETFALRRQRERHGIPSEHDDATPAPADTHEQVERLDRLQRGAEALQRLKPHEMRCILLLAEGYSYRQICEITGFTYTKVNRCLAEGRQSFLKRVEGIESGDECERFAPLISAAADGEADADDMLALRRHLRGCLACRASLREARAVPARVAALAPAGIALGAGGGDAIPIDRLQATWNWLQERIAALAVRGHEVVEMATTHKAAAVAASAAALAGGGAATMHTVAHPEAPPARAAAGAPSSKPKATAPLATHATSLRRPASAPARRRSGERAERPAAGGTTSPAPAAAVPVAQPAPAVAPPSAPAPAPARDPERPAPQQRVPAPGAFGP